MCGLVGIAGDTIGVWKDIFAELLLVDSVRGTHSTGAGFVHRHNSEFRLAKEPGNPFNLFLSNSFIQRLRMLALDILCNCQRIQ